MAKKYVPVFYDWAETTVDLTQEQKGNLIDAIVAYASETKTADEIIEEMSAVERVAFRFMKGQVDRNNEISVKRSEAASSKPEQPETNESKPEQKQANDSKSKQSVANDSKEQQSEAKPAKKSNKDDILFTRFWEQYPRHEGKQAAHRAFEKLKPNEELVCIMISAIGKQKKSSQWTENGGQFIPHPATWLNGHRWEDEVKEYRPQKTVTAQDYTQRDYSGEDEKAFALMIKRLQEEKESEVTA